MDFQLTAGTTPTINDTLLDGEQVPFDLTGYTVKFRFQGPVEVEADADIVSAVDGTVQLKLTADQTAAAGDYIGQWRATKAPDDVLVFPTVPLTFQILAAVPITAPSQVSLVTDFLDPIRAILGDFSSRYRKYEDTGIQSVVRATLKMGRVPGFSLTADQRGITPAMGDTDVKAFAQLVHHAALTLLRPVSAERSFRTRALARSVGSQRDFVIDLENALHDLEFGEMFTSYQSFANWINGMSGVCIWAHLTEMKSTETIGEINLTRAGLQHSP